MLNDISSQQHHDPKRKTNQHTGGDKRNSAGHDLRFGIQRKQAIVLVCRTHGIPFASAILDTCQAFVFPLDSRFGKEPSERHVDIGIIRGDDLRTLHNKHRGTLVEGAVCKHIGYGI